MVIIDIGRIIFLNYIWSHFVGISQVENRHNGFLYPQKDN